MTLPTTAELKRIREKSTPGPWATDPDGGHVTGQPQRRGNVWLLPSVVIVENEQDDELVALAPELLDEVIRLREAATTTDGGNQ